MPVIFQDPVYRERKDGATFSPVYSLGSCVSILEELDGGVTSDTILLGQVRLFSGITLASLISEPSAFSFPAALAYSGARALQWPHHGASGRESKT